MLFNSIEYAILFLIAFAGYWIFASNHKAKTTFLLLVSYTFYASWNVKYLALIAFSSSLDFFIGRQLFVTKNKLHRKLLLTTSLIINLGILCTFKYFNFFATEFCNLLQVFNLQAQPWHINILLPVGISFYTFQTLSYTIDIYRGKLKPTQNIVEYLLFVSFFPQLVAGPIVRAGNLLPQLAKTPSLTSKEGSNAVFLITIGLAKKIAIADFLGCHLVDPVFSNPQMYSSLETLGAAYAYAFQIYADFSAYSDIAIGSAALLGLKIPINFNAPYTASNLREFWQRWHISLSTWLKDYLYIPLGGSKNSSIATYKNLMLTMLIGGLWHGAALNFIFWGLIHGVALVLTRVIQRLKMLSHIPLSIRRFVGVFFTFHVVCAAWIFFRSQNFETAFQIFESIALLDFGYANLIKPASLVLILAFAIHWIPSKKMNILQNLFNRLPAAIQAGAVIAVILAIRQLSMTEVTPFIYFQF